MSYIKIKKSRQGTAIIISFDIKTEKFSSPSEKSKFFEELYGRRQIIKKENKVYEYYRKGLLDEINHLRVTNSVFITLEEHMKKIEEFFKEWENKVIVKSFPVLLSDKEFKLLEPKKKHYD
ncbi:MAG: hypothetical protein QXF15_00485 [Candidatus Aenigmatarchaeota archaeon]|nr:hypothetical protein [Candidatus Aenigmarchaeota archaeon]